MHQFIIKINAGFLGLSSNCHPQQDRVHGSDIIIEHQPGSQQKWARREQQSLDCHQAEKAEIRGRTRVWWTVRSEPSQGLLMEMSICRFMQHIPTQSTAGERRVNYLKKGISEEETGNWRCRLCFGGTEGYLHFNLARSLCGWTCIDVINLIWVPPDRLRYPPHPQKSWSDVWDTVMHKKKIGNGVRCKDARCCIDIPWLNINKDRQGHESLWYKTWALPLLFPTALTRSNNSCTAVINLHQIYKLLIQHSPFLLATKPLDCGWDPEAEQRKH